MLHINSNFRCDSQLQTCQADLVRDGGHKYFLSVLQDTSIPVAYILYLILSSISGPHRLKFLVTKVCLIMIPE